MIRFVIVYHIVSQPYCSLSPVSGNNKTESERVKRLSQIIIGRRYTFTAVHCFCRSFYSFLSAPVSLQRKNGNYANKNQNRIDGECSHIRTKIYLKDRESLSKSNGKGISIIHSCVWGWPWLTWCPQQNFSDPQFFVCVFGNHLTNKTHNRASRD